MQKLCWIRFPRKMLFFIWKWEPDVFKAWGDGHWYSIDLSMDPDTWRSWCYSIDLHGPWWKRLDLLNSDVTNKQVTNRKHLSLSLSHSLSHPLVKQLELRASGELGASLASQCPLSTDTSSVTAPPAADLHRLREAILFHILHLHATQMAGGREIGREWQSEREVFVFVKYKSIFFCEHIAVASNRRQRLK